MVQAICLDDDILDAVRREAGMQGRSAAEQIAHGSALVGPLRRPVITIIRASEPPSPERLKPLR